MKLTKKLTDDSVLIELGKRLSKQRLEMNLTQAELSKKAGVSKRTLERLESGTSTQLSSFIRILRAMELLHRIDGFIPEIKPGPIELLEHEGKERKRARPENKNDLSKKKWEWGDDE